MGQISSYDPKKTYTSPLAGLGEELANSTVPKGIGSFSPSKEKARRPNSGVLSHKRTNEAVGLEISHFNKDIPLSSVADIETARELRRLGFLPKEIIEYIELQKGGVVEERDKNEVLSKTNKADEKVISNNQNNTSLGMVATTTESVPVSDTEKRRRHHMRIIRRKVEKGTIEHIPLPKVLKGSVTGVLRGKKIRPHTSTHNKIIPPVIPIPEEEKSAPEITAKSIINTSTPIIVPKHSFMGVFPTQNIANKKPTAINPLTRITHKDLLGDKDEQPVVIKNTTTTAEPNIKDAPAPPQQTKMEMKVRTVGKLFKILEDRFATTEEWAGPTANSVSVHHSLSNTFGDNLSVKNTESWRDLVQSESSKKFLNDIATMNEELLISKYIPSYANSGNPSSWSTVSEFDAFEILQNPNPVYGLTDEQRLSVSELITHMEELTAKTKLNIKISPKLTIHMLYEQVRRNIASLDKLEQN